MDSETGPEAGETSRPTEPGVGDAAFAPIEPAPPVTPAESEPPSAPAEPESPFAPIEPASPFASGQQPQPQPPQPFPMQPAPGQPWPAHGRPPQNPYAFPPYGYGIPQAPTGTNGLAVAALILGICGFFLVTPVIGLILGIAALAAIRKSGQKGKGLAVSGIVLSGLWIAFFATAITLHVVNEPASARRDAGGTVVGQGTVSIFGLHPKDCFTVPAGLIGSTDSDTRTFTVVPCSTPHDSEAIGSFTATDSSFPGMAALRTESITQCLKVFSGYLQDTQSLPTGSMVQYVYPNELAWGQGEHQVTCFIQFPAATMTQLVYRDASSYTPDQLRFIQAVHPLVDAASRLNTAGDTAPLSDLQQGADDLATATQNEIAALTAAPWPADVQPSVDALVAKHRDGARAWAKAASATDETSFGDDLRDANADFDLTDMQAARTALGLKTLTPGSTS